MSTATIEQPVAAERAAPEEHRVVVIGSGFAGLGMAIRLQEAGEDFVVCERASSVGGTWRDNTYPGCACDVPSHLYSLSFAPNPSWSRLVLLPAGDLRVPEAHAPPSPACSTGSASTARSPTPAGTTRSSAGRCRPSAASSAARCWSPASAASSTRKLPDVPGLEDFDGEVLHSARWNHDYDLEGKRVAVIGTGASAIQFVPQIQPRGRRSCTSSSGRRRGSPRAAPIPTASAASASTAASRSCSGCTAATSTSTREAARRSRSSRSRG